MKRIFLFMFAVVAVSAVIAISSCKKEDTKAVITVKYASDTSKVVPYAHVRLEKYDVNVEGQCNESGVFEHVFNLESILDVRAWLTPEQSGLVSDVYGETTIRLEPGKTVKKTVFIK